jgi:hypothetical protein
LVAERIPSLVSRPLVRAGVVALAAYALGLGGFSLVASPHWARPVGVSDEQVMAAVREWLESCAHAVDAYPENCPQSAQDLARPASASFVWHPSGPLMDNAQVHWSAGTGFFLARGRVFMDYQHDRVQPDAAVEHYQGTVVLPFEAGLRWVGDGRDFGAYEFRAGLPAWNGFVLQAFGDRRLRCCEPGDLRP